MPQCQISGKNKSARRKWRATGALATSARTAAAKRTGTKNGTAKHASSRCIYFAHSASEIVLSHNQGTETDSIGD